MDNVCCQVIERHILAKLLNIFNLFTVSIYSDQDLLHLAIESPEIGDCRAEALQLQDALEQSLHDLKI